MVRITRKPRTRDQVYPSGIPSAYLPPKSIRVSNNHTFTDHTGKQALMSWWGSESNNSKLPPLASWVFYMVHPDKVQPPDFDGCRFYENLEDGQDCGVGGPLRYEFFFLPGATAEDCHAHFLGELRVRGSIWRQINKVKNTMRNLDGREETEEKEETKREGHDFGYEHDAIIDSQLPGLVLSEPDNRYMYRSWLFMYCDADIDCSGAYGQTREMYLVQFNYLPQQWEEGDEFDPMECPIFPKRMTPRDREGEEGLHGWMMERKSSHWEEEANAATSNATKLGWESW
ncbi:hypothetical protein HG530_013039 [Fusarium avenaceum]|nr:hypothetical protein HG530_013039 [Fusarium avenaceum]